MNDFIRRIGRLGNATEVKVLLREEIQITGGKYTDKGEASVIIADDDPEVTIHLSDVNGDGDVSLSTDELKALINMLQDALIVQQAR